MSVGVVKLPCDDAYDNLRGARLIFKATEGAAVEIQVFFRLVGITDPNQRIRLPRGFLAALLTLPSHDASPPLQVKIG